MMNESVSTIMSKNLVSVGPDDSLLKTKRLMKAHQIHAIPVVDAEGVLLGLITPTDMLRLDRLHAEYADIKASEVMVTKLATLDGDAKVGTAAELFLEHLFHSIPIVDEASKKLLGIVTMHDVMLYSFKKEYDRMIL